jgi:AraC-like DNA-binding protein
MSHDPLSDVLRSVRLRGAVFYYVSFRDDWVAESPAARDIANAVMPGAEHVLAYHLMAKGDGWAATNGESPVRLSAGDIVMFPHGDAHVMSRAPGMRATAANADWVFTTRDDPKPIAVAYHGGVLRPGAPVPVEEASNIVVCGFVGCDLRPFNPLIAALPRLLHQAASGVGHWVRDVLHQAVLESRERRPGSDAVLERASEMVFVDAARRYLEHLPDDASGWLAGLRDRHVGKALGAIHAAPARDWTLEELGRAAGLSRSALHERFVRFVGQPPMQYLTHWRMQLAANQLRSSHAGVASIALEVGYESEAAFTRAFKRATGLPPATWRRAQAATPPRAV